MLHKHRTKFRFSHVNQNISITKKKKTIKQTKTHPAKLKGLNSEQHGSLSISTAGVLKDG